MLTNVPTQINRAARAVVLRHPNAMDCTIFRKKVSRTSTGTPDAVGGLPTIGDLGVLDSEDEADIEWEEVGDAKIVFTGQYATEGGNWNDSDTGLIYGSPPMEALIECVLSPDHEDFFVVSKNDMVSVEPGSGFVLPYQVTDETSNINIPPYIKKFAVQPLANQTTGI